MCQKGEKAIDYMVLEMMQKEPGSSAVDQDIPGRPKAYLPFSRTEPRLYSLPDGFAGKSLGQPTSG